MSQWKNCELSQAVKWTDKAYKGQTQNDSFGYSLGTSGNVHKDNKIWEFYKIIQLSI